MVKLMKDAHEALRDKHEEELTKMREIHAMEFCEYEHNIRATLEKKVL